MSEFQWLLDERRIANHSEITIDFYQVWGNDTVFLVLKVSDEFRFISGKAKKKKEDRGTLQIKSKMKKYLKEIA